MVELDEMELFRIVEGKREAVDFSVKNNRTDYIDAHRKEIIDILGHLITCLAAGYYPFQKKGGKSQ